MMSSCDSELTASSCTNQTTAVCAGRTKADRFLAPQGGDAAMVVLKCPICKQHHHHWCHYVQHLQIHRCQACRQQHSPVAGKVAGENRAVSAPSPPRLSVNSDVNTRSPKSRGTPRQPSTFRLQFITPKLSGGFLCGRCGKCFPHWNKLWLHQRFHRRVGRPFRCSACELEFHFLGSYVDHLREHAQTHHACPSCPDTFVDQKSLSSHASNCHKHQEHLKCSTCGKCFSSTGNLRKHKLLHRSAKSHACLPCGLAFSCHAALTGHLEIHRRRLSVPRPAPVPEPFLFPYCCRKCTAKFSSTELLQAHQVCHFTAGNKAESPPESIASFIPSRAPEDIQSGTPESSGRPRQLPVSNKKHLFRYPDPNRLYVVPVISSEPPIIVQDTGEENLSIAVSADNQSGPPLRKTGAGMNSCGSVAPRWLNARGHGSGGLRELKFLVQSLLPEKCTNEASGEIDAAERAPSKDIHTCTTCTASFTDIEQLHTHYISHAKGL